MKNNPFDWQNMTAEEFQHIELASIPRDERLQILNGTHPHIKYYSFYGVGGVKETTKFFLKGKQPEGWLPEGWVE